MLIGCIYFKVVLIISGNLSFLNWLTIVPSLACFDDASLSWLFSSKPDSAKDQVLKIQHSPEGQPLKVGMNMHCVCSYSISFSEQCFDIC